MEKEELILELYKISVIKFGKFTLKSGKVSPYYFNLRSICSYPKILKKVVKAFEKILSKIKYDAVAGTPYAGIPIATAISLALNKKMIFTRKEAKDYGVGKMIIGDYKVGERIVIIDDVISDGASKLEAIKPLKKEGLVVKNMVVIIDRGQGGPQLMKKQGYKCHSIMNIQDIISVLTKYKKITPQQVKEAKEFLSAN